MILTKIKVLGAVAAALVCAFSAMIGIHQALAEAPPIDPPMVEQHEVAEIKAPAVVAVILQDKNPQPKGKKSEVPGIVKAIDLKMGTLTLTFTGDGKRGDQQFNLRALDMKVPTSLGLLLKLSELPIGTRIHVQLISEDITAIRADHPTMAVSFANVDADKKTITVRAERGSDTYQVGDNAKITLNGKPGKLAEVPTNQKCFVTLSLDRKTVLVLTAGRAPRDGEVGKGRVQKTTGVISKVEGDKVTVTIAGDNGERTANFTITKETSILIETDQNKTSEGKTTDLRAGQRVTITTDQGAGVVTVLVLQTPKQLKDSK